MSSPPDFTRLESPDYWRSLCPSLRITEEESAIHEPMLSSSDKLLQHEFERLRRDGYFCLHSVFPLEEMKTASQSIHTLHEHGLLPVFGLVYDEFWSLPWRLSSILSELLGGDFELLPDVWIWMLQPQDEETGWRPHRDRGPGRVEEDGTPHVLSFWIPLTDATPENGCMYVVPASWDPRYHNYGDQQQEEATLDMQNIRALPAPAGSVMGWTSHLLHWGGRASRYASEPRISVAFELQRKGFKAQETFFLPEAGLPAFELRLALIARQLLQYQHMHPLEPALARKCRQWLKALPGRRSFAKVLKGWMGK